MKRRIVLLISASVLLLSIITVAATSETSESKPRVYIFPPEIIGGSFAINVNIAGLEASHKLISVQLRLEFNVTVLSHTGVIEGDFMRSFAPHGTYSLFVAENDYILGFIQILPDPETGNFTEPFPEGSGTFAAFCFVGWLVGLNFNPTNRPLTLKAELETINVG